MNAPREPHEATVPTPHDLGFALPAPARVSGARVIALGLVATAALGAAFVVAYLPRRSAASALVEAAHEHEQHQVVVTAIVPKLVGSEHALKLPGSIQPLEEAVIYAQASGYVRRWLVDLGDRVKTGDLLAEIDTPEVDQQLGQARASIAKARAAKVQAEANQHLAVSRADRAQKLGQEGLAAQQDVETAQAQSAISDADTKVADAEIAAEQANIQRLMDLKAFARVTSPFAGTVTARTVDRGSLVTAGNGTPMFKLASTDIVRVFMNVPQDVAPSVAVGATATVLVREFPGQKFEGTVAHTAGALDPATRTLSTEVRVPNPDRKLLAGMYAEVALNLPSPRKVFELPSTALFNDAQGLRVALITPQNTLHFQPIVIDRDQGPTIQIANGLNGDERLVQIAGVELEEGEHVDVRTAKATP
ncbi:MAG TPA: efflux RND transporter periplasmic adaptor subunit [Polyangiaceae bacterium]|jgi:RND family efflux transporter MFP subunit